MLPLVFLTGYKASYTPGGSAVPLHQPPLEYGYKQPPTWWDWLMGRKYRFTLKPAQGILVFYKGNNAAFITSRIGDNGTVREFVPPNFEPNGHTYRQLTPDGVLK